MATRPKKINDFISRDDLVMFMGRRGWGKSTACKQMQNAFSRIVVIDIMHEYKPRGKNEFLSHGFFDFKNKILELENKKSFKLICRLDPENEDTEFHEMMRVIFEVGDLLLVVEEVHHFASVHKMPAFLKHIILRGRHKGITFFGTTQRPGELHKTILSQCNHLFVGSIFEKNDTQYLSDFLGRKTAKMLQSLKQFEDKAEFIYWQPGKEPKIIFVNYGIF